MGRKPVENPKVWLLRHLGINPNSSTVVGINDLSSLGLHVYTLFCGFLNKEEDTYFSHFHSGFGYMICLATGMVVDMTWPKASKAKAQWAYHSFFDYCHQNIIPRWAQCPWHDPAGEGWDTRIVKPPQLIWRLMS